MRIGLVGWGVETQSAFKYFGTEHEYLIVNEEPSPDLPRPTNKIKVRSLPAPRRPGLTGNVADLTYLEGIEKCDRIVYSVTAYKNLQKKFGDDKHFWHKATTVLQIFFEEVKTKNIIGITGSKGKGTTSTLTAKLLEAQAKTVHLGGNIGRGVLDFIKDVEASDWVVLELSNFQLIDFSYSPHIAVCLMITNEHQDWHPDIEEYVEAKANIFKHQAKDDVAIYFVDNDYSKRIAGYSAGKKIPYFAKPGAFIKENGMIAIGQDEIEIINKRHVGLLGEHNLQNICAALTAVFEATRGSLRVDKAKAVLSSFRGLEHRLELVRELEGVKYYDDSFATTPETVIVALKALVQPIVLILGGHDKGLDYEEMIKEITIRDRVRHVITIGDIGPRLAEMLRQKHYKNITERLETMPDIVAEAKKRAQPGDVVLLSCGTSSFGLFQDYKDRGDQFKKSVQSLA